jgi:putative copper export protein/mono/diheme cytochrome c family protein
VLPTFAIDGGILLALTRGVAVAALLSVFGSLTFRVFVATRVFDRMPAEVTVYVNLRLRRLTQFGMVAALFGLSAWLVAQSADMVSAGSVRQVIKAVPAVLQSTDFGHVIGWQILAVLGALAVMGRQDDRGRQRVALGIATVALVLQAGHSHAASMYSGPSFLLASDVAHLLGAGAWLGGLLPLLSVVRDAPAKAGALAARWFSPLGKLCLVTLTASALFQGWVLVESIPGLVGTAYGWMVLVKLGLFGVLFAFAYANRYRFAPALLQDDPAAAKRVLVRSIAVQTGFGLAIVAAASVLSSLPPAMHEQPVWPFPDLFTLNTVNEDPDFLREVLSAVLALAGAAFLLVIAALIRRRIRWAAVAAACVITWFAVPHLDLLFVPAYPTSFYHSPTQFAATSIVQGAALYPANCAMCHGADGHGDGPAAKGLSVPPADLTAAHLWMHSDGELFWWLAHGIEAPEGGLAMPGFERILSDDDRWHLMDYIRAHNAGVTFHTDAAWSPPVQAPELQAQCANGRTISLADLRGSFVRLVIGATSSTPTPGIITVLATSDPAARAGERVCIASDEDLPQAYAVVSGLAPSELPGSEFLIDAEGWLRAVQRPTAAPGWNDPKILATEIQDLAAHPIAANAAASHAHMQM